ncbi:hypothetical protein HAX54_023669 [Datura stramonium]|uniref:Peptidase A1 domain-containing protein n=1 Tax=Datura stramonium TaxID=4076 RepID=A0ABS8UYG2_DATST|nr:hypothetical protein [Datura stramonium]
MVDIPLGSFDTCYKEDQSGQTNFPVVKLYFGHEKPENLLCTAQQQDRAGNIHIIPKLGYRDSLSKWRSYPYARKSRSNSKMVDQILKETPVTYNQGHYVAMFKLGSEKTRNYLLIDTGSYLIWWQCAPCIPGRCFKARYSPLYNYTTSNTFRKVDCVANSSTCITSDPEFRCSLGSKLCFYEQVYQSGETTKGFIASEIITFSSDNTQARVNFGCSDDQKSGTNDFSGSFSGIVGLSKRVSSKTPGGYSLPSQLGSSLFALCLPSTISTQPSFLTFNKAPWVYGTEAKIVKNKLNPHFYYVNLHKIVINDKEVPVDPSWWNGRQDGQRLPW